MSWF